MLYFELKRYEKYLKDHCNTNISKYVYQSELINKDVQFFTKSAQLQDRVMAYRDIYDVNSIRDYVAFHFGVSSILESCRINNAYSHRICRLKRVISSLLSEPCTFITLTFTDDVLNKTSFQTRRAYVRRFLKSYNCSYVANVDYGEEKEREHYHCILPSRVSFSSWKYGIINFKPINSCNEETLSMYISKLTNHSIKHTTKRHHVIYSRISKN